MTAIPHRDHSTAHPWDEIRVLREYPLRDGHELAGTSRFSDDVWNLRPACHQHHARSLTLDFTTIPQGYRLLAKEVTCAYMAMPLPQGEQRPSLATIRGHFSFLKRFFWWLQDQRGGSALVDLTAADLGAYARIIRDALQLSRTRSKALAVVRRIWRFRTVLPGDRLMFDPQQVDGWATRRDSGSGENRTDRITEQVFGPLIVWATRFVDVFAPDIIAMTHEWAQLRSVPRSHRRRQLGLLPSLEELLARHLEENRPLPGRQEAINYSFLGKTLNCDPSALNRTPAYIERIQAAAESVGIDQETYFYTPTTVMLDGAPWLPKISNEYGDQSLPVLSRLLQTACYILIAFYSGMRDSEIKHLHRGCLHIQRDADGRAYRWKLHSRAFKGERDPTGTPAAWTVGEPAGRAIRVLEQLQPQGTDLLFQPLPYGIGWAQEHAGGAMKSSSTSTWLNRFVKWVNTYCAEHERTDTIPDIDGQPFKLKTSQFRRTLAFFIARRPGGAIAGAIAYRHLSIQMFEGYAGTSEAGFRAEVESEQALARGEHLIDLTDTHRHHLQGPGAEEAARRMEEFGASTTGFEGSVLTDRRRLQRLMKRNDPAVYPGTYVTCVYRHDKALCRPRNDSSGQVLPELADCKPLTCRNVALTSENITAWRAESDKIDQHLARRPRLPPVLEQRLKQRQEQIQDFLDRHVEQEAE